MTVQQLPFDLGVRAAYAREDFWVSPCNAEAVAWLDRYPEWPVPALVLHGPAGSGKTHLAHVFQERLGGRALVWDAVDETLAAATSYQAEQDIFHAWTRYADSGAPLLLLARQAPSAWNIRLADLRSRIQATPVAQLKAPDDQLMSVVLTKMASDRQMLLPGDVTAYLLKRLERSFAAVGQAVEAIDRAALSQKRAVTIPLVRETLQFGADDGDESNR